MAGAAPTGRGARVYGGIVPHAGWHFSGKAAARVFCLTSKLTQPQVVVRLWRPPGRELPTAPGERRGLGDPLGQRSPGHGVLRASAKRLTLGRRVPRGQHHRGADPHGQALFPPGQGIGRTVAPIPPGHGAGRRGGGRRPGAEARLLAFGSTDLTHYGPNYGWAPKGLGRRRSNGSKRSMISASSTPPCN